jgi:hypothetical protein
MPREALEKLVSLVVGEMPAARDASTADSPRTARACLSTAPNDGAIMHLSYS